MVRLPRVEDFMDVAFVTFRPDTPIFDAIDTLLRRRLFGVCVVDKKNRLLGILSERDCLRLCVLIEEGKQIEVSPGATVADYMHKAVQTVPPWLLIHDAARILMAQSFRRLPVVADDRLVGQITRRDILRGMRRFTTNKGR